MAKPTNTTFLSIWCASSVTWMLNGEILFVSLSDHISNIILQHPVAHHLLENVTDSSILCITRFSVKHIKVIHFNFSPHHTTCLKEMFIIKYLKFLLKETAVLPFSWWFHLGACICNVYCYLTLVFLFLICINVLYDYLVMHLPYSEELCIMNAC
jgi:hypothetical protein